LPASTINMALNSLGDATSIFIKVKNVQSGDIDLRDNPRYHVFFFIKSKVNSYLKQLH